MIRSISSLSGFALALTLIAIIALPLRAANEGLATDFAGFGSDGSVATRPCGLRRWRSSPTAKLL
ncbi:hypothetical protein HC891_24205 [Candidatus Gracilibacteria bacterium]|nr:hypothetical protein [Candidatus Gracilibacteria bacterium]